MTDTDTSSMYVKKIRHQFQSLRSYKYTKDGQNKKQHYDWFLKERAKTDSTFIIDKQLNRDWIRYDTIRYLFHNIRRVVCSPVVLLHRRKVCSTPVDVASSRHIETHVCPVLAHHRVGVVVDVTV